MDLFSILGACLRRWYVVLPIFAITAVLAFQSYFAVQESFTGSVSQVVLGPIKPATDQEPAVDDGGNPYSGQGGARFASAVLTRNINSTTFMDRMGLEPGSGFAIEATNSANQPILLIEATAPTPDEVFVVLKNATKQAAKVLDEVQAAAGADKNSRYRLAPAVPPGSVEDVTPSRLRSAGAIFVVGIGLAAAVANAVDLILLKRKRRGVPTKTLPENDPPQDLSDRVTAPRITRKHSSEVMLRKPPRLTLPKYKSSDGTDLDDESADGSAQGASTRSVEPNDLVYVSRRQDGTSTQLRAETDQ